MRRQLRWYGASPLHLLAMLACFCLAGYAAARLIPSAPIGIAIWFLGAVVGHDLVLMPLYTLADRSAMIAIRHREPQLPAGPWINYLRVPAALSGILLLVWFPLILRLSAPYPASTTLSADPYVWHWLAVTGALFLLSAVALAYQVRRSSRSAPAPALALAEPREPPAAPAAAADGTDPDQQSQADSLAHESEPETDAAQVTGEPDRKLPTPPESQAGEPVPVATDEPAPVQAPSHPAEDESPQLSGPQDGVPPEADGD